jgi:hypothetical protein
MDSCELVPESGIRCGGVEIFFGKQRKDLRESLGWKPSGEGMWDDEDEYLLDDGREWLRLRFVDEKLCDIEFLAGSLRYQDIELHATVRRELEHQLENLGYSCKPTRWLAQGKDCAELHINIASRDDVGDHGDEIEWIITSRDFHTE